MKKKIKLHRLVGILISCIIITPIIVAMCMTISSQKDLIFKIFYCGIDIAIILLIVVMYYVVCHLMPLLFSKK